MKKKHYIKTIEDIKYCEENGLTLYNSDEYEETFLAFENGVWNRYDADSKKLLQYGWGLDLTPELYYYEEESEELQEATEKDIGKLCEFFDDDLISKKRFVGVLKAINEDTVYRYDGDSLGKYMRCRPLTKAEIQEFMEKAE